MTLDSRPLFPRLSLARRVARSWRLGKLRPWSMPAATDKRLHLVASGDIDGGVLQYGHSIKLFGHIHVHYHIHIHIHIHTHTQLFAQYSLYIISNLVIPCIARVNVVHPTIRFWAAGPLPTHSHPLVPPAMTLWRGRLSPPLPRTRYTRTLYM